MNLKRTLTHPFKKLQAFKRSIALLLLFVSINFMAPQAVFAQPSETTEFAQRIDQIYTAWNSHNPAALAQYYAKDSDLVFYDALPMQYTGWSNYQTGIQKNLFDRMPKFKLSAHDDVQLTRKGNIAWTTFTWHLSAEMKDGTPIEAEGRQTDIWEQRGSKWLIVHEHISSPVAL